MDEELTDSWYLIGLYEMFCLCIRVCTVCVPSAHRDQKGMSDPLELQLTMVVNHYVSAGNWTQALCKSSQYF